MHILSALVQEDGLEMKQGLVKVRIGKNVKVKHRHLQDILHLNPSIPFFQSVKKKSHLLDAKKTI